MKMLRDDVVAVCVGLKFLVANKWNRKKLAKKLIDIAELGADGLEIGEDDVEDDAERERLMGIFKQIIDAEGDVELVEDEADLDDPVVDSIDTESEESKPEPDDSESVVEPEPEEDDIVDSEFAVESESEPDKPTAEEETEPEVDDPEPVKDKKPEKPRRRRRKGKKKDKKKNSEVKPAESEKPKQKKGKKEEKPKEKSEIEEKLKRKKGKKKKESTKKEKPKTEKYTRQSAVHDAIRRVCKETVTIKQIAEVANQIYADNGGKLLENVANMSNVTTVAVRALFVFGVLQQDGKGYKLV